MNFSVMYSESLELTAVHKFQIGAGLSPYDGHISRASSPDELTPSLPGQYQWRE